MKKIVFSFYILLISSVAFGANIKSYFNNKETKSYIDPYRKVRKPGDDLEAVLIKAADVAKSSLDVAVQDFNLTNYAKALVRAKKRGVKVRVMLEDKYNASLAKITAAQKKQLPSKLRSKVKEQQDFLDANDNGIISKKEIETRDALTILRRGKISVKDDFSGPASGVMHHKFVIIDKKFLIVSSANFTRSGIHGDFNSKTAIGNANSMIVFSNNKLANYFLEKEFIPMWEKGLFKTKKNFKEPVNFSMNSQNTLVKVQFAPTDIKKYGMNSSTNGLIAKTLARAKRSIKSNLFVFSSQYLVDQLGKIKRNRPSIKMEFLVDPLFATRYYSQLLDMWGLKMRNKQNCKYDANNRPWRLPENRGGVPDIDSDDKLHHKFSIVDDKVLIYGSQNWSKSGNEKNDETLLIIQDAKIVKSFVVEHNRLYKDATKGVTKELINKIDSINAHCR